MSERPPRDLPGLLDWGEELRVATAEAERPPRRHRARPLVLAAGAVLVVLLGAVAVRGL